MKKSQFNLLKLAHKFGNKYAQSQTLKQIIEAAAGWGEKSANGIMNFPAEVQKDQSSLVLDINVGSGIMGGSTVTVAMTVLSTDGFSDPSLSQKYARVPEQVKNYLEKHISSFPQIPTGNTRILWDGKSGQPEGVASN